MKKGTRQVIEDILLDELNNFVTLSDIENAINKMDNGFDSGDTINKEKFYEACELGRKHLETICLPIHLLTSQTIYINKVLIAFGKVSRAF